MEKKVEHYVVGVDNQGVWYYVCDINDEGYKLHIDISKAIVGDSEDASNRLAEMCRLTKDEYDLLVVETNPNGRPNAVIGIIHNYE